MDRRFGVSIAALVAVSVWGALARCDEPKKGEEPKKASTAAPAAPEIKWQADLRAAHEIAVKDKKPMLIVFGAEWCTYCKKMEQTTLAQPQMVSYVNTAFVPVHLDLDKDAKIAEILEVKSIPCTVILSPDADLLGRHVGFAKPQQYYETLVEARKMQSQVQQTLYLQNKE